MDREFKAKIEERMREIPAPLVQAIRESGWENIVFDIGRKYSLHIDDIGNMQNELILVLTGISHPDNFNSFVRSELGIDSDKANDIIEQINLGINEKIKNALKRTLGAGGQADEKVVEEEDNENIKSSEKSVLRSAGISLGDEPEALHVLQVEVSSAGGEKPIKLPLPPDVKASKPAGVTATPAPTIPDIAAKLENSAVFKNKSSNYLDPYREPVE